MSLVEAFFKIFVWIFSRGLIFVLLNWVLLGLTPSETLNTSYVNIKGIIDNSELFSDSFNDIVQRFSEKTEPTVKQELPALPEITPPVSPQPIEIDNLIIE